MQSSAAGRLFEFAGFTLDLARGCLRAGDQQIDLRPKSFDVLRHLLENAGRLVSKDELVKTVWPSIVVTDDALTHCVSEVRRALGDGEQRIIKTVPRRGYLVVAPVSLRATDAESPTLPDFAPPTSQIHVEAPSNVANQEVTFCTTADGVRLAVALVGKGDVLVKTANWLNHVEYDWQSPVWAATFGRWAATHRLIRYDQRGTGLSDWDTEEISFEAFVSDLEAVIKALGLQRFALFGSSQGGAVAIAYAARCPERVSKLVLHGAYALGRTKRQTTADDEQAAAYLTLIRHGWGYPNSAFMQAFSSLYLPNGTTEQIKWFGELQRLTTSPENAIKIRNACDEIDILDLLPKVEAPTFVTHSRHDNVVPFDHGRMIASAIPGARFVGLESSNHIILPGEPAWDKFMADMELFLSTPR